MALCRVFNRRFLSFPGDSANAAGFRPKTPGHIGIVPLRPARGQIDWGRSQERDIVQPDDLACGVSQPPGASFCFSRVSLFRDLSSTKVPATSRSGTKGCHRLTG